MYPDTKVNIMPAALDSMSLNSWIAVKYQVPKKPFTCFRNKGVWVLHLPDRTIYAGRSNTLGVAACPDADEFIPLPSPSNPEALAALGFKHFMVNPTSKDNQGFLKRTKWCKSFSDSGGFQLARGIEEFVDPETLGDFYRDCIDYGIGLDIPIPLHLQETDWFKRMCRVTILNNKVLTSRMKGSDAKLYDVSHGLTLDNRKKWLHQVMKDPQGPGIALGGIGQAIYDTKETSVATAVINLCYVVHASKGIYKQYHVLGTTSPFMQAVFNLLTQQDIAPYISADASTYAQFPIAFATRSVPYTDYTTDFLMLPTDARAFGLFCNCDICNLCGYPAAYRMNVQANSSHMLFIYRRQSAMVEELVKDFLAGTIKLKTLVEAVAPHPHMRNLCTLLFKFVLDMPMGFDKAYQKHEKWLDTTIRKYKVGKTLFGGSSAVAANEKLANQATASTKAIVRYEEYHAKR